MLDESKSILFDDELFQEDRKTIDLHEEKTPIHSSWIQLKWPVGKRLHYGFQLDIEQNQEQQEVKYEVDIIRLENNEEGHVLFEVNRTSEVYINEIIPDLVYDKLAYLAGSIFYPLIIQLDNNGEIISIANHQAILSRWEDTKGKIYEDFEGDLVSNYVSKMDNLLQSKDQIVIAICKNDWFLNIFFKPIYKDYNQEISNESKQWYYPILESFNQSIEVEQTLGKNYNHFGAIEIIHEGMLTRDEDEENLPVNSKYYGQYVLHPRLRHIIAVLGEWNIDEDENSKNIKAKLFCMPPKGKDIDYDFIEDYEDTSNFVTSEGEKVNKKLSFWDRLFS